MIKSPWYKPSDPRSTEYVEPEEVVRLKGNKTVRYEQLIQWMADNWNDGLPAEEFKATHRNDGLVCLIADTSKRTNGQVLDDIVELRVLDDLRR